MEFVLSASGASIIRDGSGMVHDRKVNYYLAGEGEIFREKWNLLALWIPDISLCSCCDDDVSELAESAKSQSKHVSFVGVGELRKIRGLDWREWNSVCLGAGLGHLNTIEIRFHGR